MSTTISQAGSQVGEPVKLHFRIVGSGPVCMVLLHGFGSSHLTWEDIEPFLMNGVTLHELDLKGHGESPKPNDHAYSLRDQAALVTSFVLEKDLREIVLAGHSYGGAVALMTILRLRSLGEHWRIRGLVLIASAAYPQEMPFFVSVFRHFWLSKVVGQFPTRRVVAHTLKRIFRDRSRVDAERIDRYARFLALPGARAALSEIAMQILPADLDQFASDLRTIEVRTLIIWGDHDWVVPLSVGERLHGNLENSEIRVIPNCGHIPQEEQPQVTANLITAYLKMLFAEDPHGAESPSRAGK